MHHIGTVSNKLFGGLNIVIILRCSSSCVSVCSLMADKAYLISKLSVINTCVHVDQVSLENDHSEDDPLDLALRSLCFHSVSRTVFAV